MMRPLDVDDLRQAILSACRHHPAGVPVHELWGARADLLPHLVERVAGMMGRSVSCGVMPI
jgi:hypothetical protein